MQENYAVAPLVGAWIEIPQVSVEPYHAESLPSWERGLKWQITAHMSMSGKVAPLVGAWIEIRNRVTSLDVKVVAPLVGAWIEIEWKKHTASTCSSLPSWERGLKFYQKELHIFLYIVAPLVGAWIEILKGVDYYPECDVAPLVGAWIEISKPLILLQLKCSRSPRGSVD